jgi:hypothetical protein
VSDTYPKNSLLLTLMLCLRMSAKHECMYMIRLTASLSRCICSRMCLGTSSGLDMAQHMRRWSSKTEWTRQVEGLGRSECVG